MIYRWHILSPGHVVAGHAGVRLRTAFENARAANGAAFTGSPTSWPQTAEDLLIEHIQAQAQATSNQNIITTVDMAYRWPTWQPTAGQNPNGFTLPIALLPTQSPAPAGPPTARLFTTRNSFRFDATDLPVPRA